VTHLEWLVLDATADDFESVVQILPHVRTDLPGASNLDVARAILDLLQRRYLQQLESTDISLHELMSAHEHQDAPFWFGMTTLGADAWERSAPDFGAEPPNWNEAYVCHFDHRVLGGWCDGVSPEVCVAAIRHSRDSHAVREDTFRTENIESFAPKYYKRLQGGVRVSFDLKSPDQTMQRAAPCSDV
jgi:hypothetical protein